MGANLRLIDPDGFAATDDGFRLSIRLNWYRSLAISCLETLKVSLDGQPIAPEAVRLELNGKVLSLAEAEDAVEEYWFVQDSLGIRVAGAGQVKTGESHEVAVEYALRFPYIAIGPGRFLVNVSAETATCVAG